MRTPRCALVTTAVFAWSCTRALPPPELVNARAAYTLAANGITRTFNPSGLHDAERQLASAEASFEEDGGSRTTEAQAYRAQRAAELAVVIARTRQAENQTDEVITMRDNRERNTVAPSAVEPDEAALTFQEPPRVASLERSARVEAAWAKVGSVQHEARGTVITLSGTVLFGPKTSELLDAASGKLTDVANALAEENPRSHIIVQGHTDSEGAEESNMELSERRADNVRSYLVNAGVAAGRISSEGFGETRPIAEHDSPAGRQNNGRVEIVIRPANR